MAKRNWMVLLGLAVLVLASVACEFNATTANIKDAYLVTDEASGQKTTSYTQDQPFVLVVEQANAPDDTKVKAVWYSLDAAGAATQFVEKEMVTGGTPVTFSATNNGPWPVGNYKVELYLNDKLNKTVEFSVQ
jgi:outer membrane usher protein FimD/PapC